MTDQCTAFGGYLDIIVDFTIYGLIPLGVTGGDPSYSAWFLLVLLEVSFFVNAAGLFMLSSLIEKSAQAKKAYGDKGEVTAVRMPPALIEGTESLVLFGLIILLPQYQVVLYAVFACGVTITILQRLLWASENL